MTGVNQAVRAASLEGKTCLRRRKQADETPKRHAKENARPQIKEASRRDFEKAREGEMLVLKLRKQAGGTPKRHAKWLVLKSRK